MREIKFSLSEGRYISDTFAATGTSMAVRVEFEKAGSCTLMKSIDTGKFVPSAALLGYADDVKVVEKTILGVVPAQNFYIDFNTKAVPAKIYVLDGPSGGGGGEDVEALKALITQQGEKLDGISSAIGRQDTVLASHTGKLDSNGQKADEIAGKVEDVKGGMDAQAVTLGEVKSALASLEGKIQENDLESASLFLEVQTTTVTNPDGSTDAVPSNRHIRIVDDGLKCYTIAEWNAMAVAAQFDKAKMPKPVGFSIECNGQKAVLYWPYTGQVYDVTGTVAEPSERMRHSIYDYSQITAAASGNDTGEAANDGSIGSYHSRAWSVEEQGGNLVLKCGNTGQQWTMAKGCGNANVMNTGNSKDRTHALYVQNEWMRHRFAVCSGIATDSADGTYAPVTILNAEGSQAAAGEDMYFYVGGSKTGLLAKYNINNKHKGTTYLTDAIRDWIYEEQKKNGVDMNDTGINSGSKPLLVPGAKGAEAVAVGGFWYIITPYISNPGQSTKEKNIIDSPIAYYANGEDGKRNNAVVFIPNEKILYPYWTNRNIIVGLISYLRSKEGRSDIPTTIFSWIWSVVRYSSTTACYVYTGGGNASLDNTWNNYYVALASAL